MPDAPTGRDGSGGWEQEFARLRPLYERLAEEVRFAIHRDLDAQDIKTHDVSARAKSPASLREKASRKEYEHPLQDAPDLAGVRVVTLFLSDIARVDEIIRRHVAVESEEDWIEGGDAASFGYMSRHYVGTLADHYSGARYDDVKGLKVEIQLRTIIMDAWAHISHYLAYKSDSSIPRELRRQFSALSGLFYVAEQQFESLAAASGRVQEEASAAIEAGAEANDVDLNLDTLTAWLRERFPDRTQSRRNVIAILVEDLRKAGYSTLGEVEASVQQAAASFEKAERTKGMRFTDMGVVRASLRRVDPQFDAVIRGRTQAFLTPRGKPD